MSKIFVIDDEAGMRSLLMHALEGVGHEVVETGAGASAIERIPLEKPDLVLCDVGLLDMSGHEVLQAVRANPDTSNIPFVLMTGVADLQGMREGMRLGADDYLPKPFDLKDLITMISARLRKAEELRHEVETKARLLRSHISMMLPEELLTPLSGIIGLADILRSDADRLTPPEAAEIGRDIQNSGERLHRLIRNFLIYSQLELLAVERDRNEPLTQVVPCQAAKVVSEVAERIAERQGRRDDLVVAVAAAEVPMAEGHLVKLVEEVVDNAFRYSERGKLVDVRSRMTDGKLWLTVADEGCGIPDDIVAELRAPNQFERIFRERPSSGLGLAIAVKIAELHQGRAIIQSQPGTGTSILFELPTMRPPAGAPTVTTGGSAA